MSYWTGRYTFGITPSTTSSIGFQPTWIHFEAGPKNGASSTVSQRASGNFDGTRKNYITSYHDATGADDQDGNTKALRVRERVSGAMTDVMGIDTCVFTATGFTITGTPNTAYNITITCGN